ncbi:hypothetical protein DI270_010390 [Microbispora triticiradicis]|uniref:Uncharacterized protein n=1 Tax=Microbispora triticiradicis TaxID=2200763 RepID=A0ABX9LPX5_9ACTN|nr:hypothetical protein DI270_010390 [Microbispora triticiradicis]
MRRISAARSLAEPQAASATTWNRPAVSVTIGSSGSATRASRAASRAASEEPPRVIPTEAIMMTGSVDTRSTIAVAWIVPSRNSVCARLRTTQ